MTKLALLFSFLFLYWTFVASPAAPGVFGKAVEKENVGLALIARECLHREFKSCLCFGLDNKHRKGKNKERDLLALSLAGKGSWPDRVWNRYCHVLIVCSNIHSQRWDVFFTHCENRNFSSSIPIKYWRTFLAPWAQTIISSFLLENFQSLQIKKWNPTWVCSSSCNTWDLCVCWALFVWEVQ